MCAAAFRQQTLWIVHRGKSTARRQELVNYQTSAEAQERTTPHNCLLYAASRPLAADQVVAAALAPLHLLFKQLEQLPAVANILPRLPGVVRRLVEVQPATSDREMNDRAHLLVHRNDAVLGDSPLDLVLERGRVAILCLRLRGLACLEWAFIQNAFHLEIFLSAQAQVSASSFARRDNAITFPSDALICTRCG